MTTLVATPDATIFVAFDDYTETCEAGPRLVLNITLESDDVSSSDGDEVRFRSTSAAVETSDLNVIELDGYADVNFTVSEAVLLGDVATIKGSQSIISCDDFFYYESKAECRLLPKDSTGLNQAYLKTTSPVAYPANEDFSITVMGDETVLLANFSRDDYYGYLLTFWVPVGIENVIIDVAYLGETFGERVSKAMYQNCIHQSELGQDLASRSTLVNCSENAGVLPGSVWLGCNVTATLVYHTAGRCFNRVSGTVEVLDGESDFTLGDFHLGSGSTSGIDLLDSTKLEFQNFNFSLSASPVIVIQFQLLPSPLLSSSRLSLRLRANVTEVGLLGTWTSTLLWELNLVHPRMESPRVAVASSSAVSCSRHDAQGGSLFVGNLVLQDHQGNAARYQSVTPDVFISADEIRIVFTDFEGIRHNATSLSPYRNTWTFALTLPNVIGLGRIAALLNLNGNWTAIGAGENATCTINVVADCTLKSRTLQPRRLGVEIETMTCNSDAYVWTGRPSVGCSFNVTVAYDMEYACADSLTIDFTSPMHVLAYSRTVIVNASSGLAERYVETSVVSNVISVRFSQFNMSSSYSPYVVVSVELYALAASETPFQFTVEVREMGPGGSASNTSSIDLIVLPFDSGKISAANSVLRCDSAIIRTGSPICCNVTFFDEHGSTATFKTVYPFSNASSEDFDIFIESGEQRDVDEYGVVIARDRMSFCYVVSVAGYSSVRVSYNGSDVGDDSGIVWKMVYANCSEPVRSLSPGSTRNETWKRCGQSEAIRSNQVFPGCEIQIILEHFTVNQCFDELNVTVSFPTGLLDVGSSILNPNETTTSLYNALAHQETIDTGSTTHVALRFSRMIFATSNQPSLRFTLPFHVKETDSVEDLSVDVLVSEMSSSRSSPTVGEISLRVVQPPVAFYFSAVNFSSSQVAAALLCSTADTIAFSRPGGYGSLWTSPSHVTSDDIERSQFGCGIGGVASNDLVRFVAIIESTASHPLYDIEVDIGCDGDLASSDSFNATFGNGNPVPPPVVVSRSPTGRLRLSEMTLNGRQANDGENVLVVAYTIVVDEGVYTAARNACVAELVHFSSVRGAEFNEALLMDADDVQRSVSVGLADLKVDVALGSARVSASRLGGQESNDFGGSVKVAPESCVELNVTVTFPASSHGSVVVTVPHVHDETSSVGGVNSRVNMSAVDGYVTGEGITGTGSLLSGSIAASRKLAFGQLATARGSSRLDLVLSVVAPLQVIGNVHGDAADLEIIVQYGSDAERLGVAVAIPVQISEPSLAVSIESLGLPLLQGGDVVQSTVRISHDAGHLATAYNVRLKVKSHKNMEIIGSECLQCNGLSYDAEPSTLTAELQSNRGSATLLSGDDFVNTGSDLELRFSHRLLNTIPAGMELKFEATVRYSSAGQSCGSYTGRKYVAKDSSASFWTRTPNVANARISNSTNNQTSSFYLAPEEQFTYDVTVKVFRVAFDFNVTVVFPFLGYHRFSLMELWIANATITSIGRGVRCQEIAWGPCYGSGGGVTAYPGVASLPDDWCPYVGEGIVHGCYHGFGAAWNITNGFGFVLHNVSFDGNDGDEIVFGFRGSADGDFSDHDLNGRRGRVEVNSSCSSARLDGGDYVPYDIELEPRTFPLVAAEPELDPSLDFEIVRSERDDEIVDAGDYVCFSLELFHSSESLISAYRVEMELTLTEHVVWENVTNATATFRNESSRPEYVVDNVTSIAVMKFNYSDFLLDDVMSLHFCGVVIQETPPGITLRHDLVVSYDSDYTIYSKRYEDETSSAYLRIMPVVLTYDIVYSSVNDTDTAVEKEASF